MHPAGRNRFHRADNIREAMRRPQADEQMNVVVNSADCLRNATKIAHDAAEIRVQPFAPRWDEMGARRFQQSETQRAMACRAWRCARRGGVVGSWHEHTRRD